MLAHDVRESSLWRRERHTATRAAGSVSNVCQQQHQHVLGGLALTCAAASTDSGEVRAHTQSPQPRNSRLYCVHAVGRWAPCWLWRGQPGKASASPRGVRCDASGERHATAAGCNAVICNAPSHGGTPPLNSMRRIHCKISGSEPNWRRPPHATPRHIGRSHKSLQQAVWWLVMSWLPPWHLLSCLTSCQKTPT